MCKSSVIARIGKALNLKLLPPAIWMNSLVGQGHTGTTTPPPLREAVPLGLPAPRLRRMPSLHAATRWVSQRHDPPPTGAKVRYMQGSWFQIPDLSEALRGRVASQSGHNCLVFGIKGSGWSPHLCCTLLARLSLAPGHVVIATDQRT